MSNIQYAEKLQVLPIPNIEHILDVVRDDTWYFSDSSLRSEFTQNAFDVFYNAMDNLNEQDLKDITSKLTYYSNKDENFMRKLMKKTIEFGYPFIESVQGDFDIFTKEEKVEYVKALNANNYYDFDFLKYRITKDHGATLLCKIYEEHFFGDSGITPCENYNLLIVSQNLGLLFNNPLVNNKHQIFETYIDKDDACVFLYNIARVVQEKNINIIEHNLLQPVLEKMAKQTRRYSILNNITELFGILNDKDIHEAACKLIIQTPSIKEGFMRMLQEKINMPRDYDIRNFDDKFNECKNMNFLQYMIFTNPKSFAIELCKQDKDFMQLFNNVIHQNHHGFLYENSPLDLVLKEIIPSNVIENLYMHKLINNELKPQAKDKFCAILFKCINESHPNDKRYHNFLNGISLMNSNLINKYAKHYKDIMLDNKLEDIKSVRNMLDLQKALPEHNNKPAPRVKI